MRRFASKILLSLTLVLGVSGFSAPARADPVLTGAMVFDGVPPDTSGFWWSTNSFGYYLFMAEGATGGPMINDAAGHISYNLTPGVHTFYLFGDWDHLSGKDTPWGLSLTFDGQSPENAWSTQQGIGVTTPEAASAFSSQPLSEAWNGSFQYIAGGFSVKLEDFNIFVADQTGFDRVSGYSESANFRDDAVGILTLSVSVVPPPPTAKNFVTHLTAAKEVPPRDCRSQGQAIFKLSKDGSELNYRLIASNIENVTAAHIHLGPAGVNAGVVLFLYGDAPPDGGPHNGVLAEGTKTAADLVGALSGSPDLSVLVAAMATGGAYVNVHTNDGVAPTNTGCGDFPGGQIRGQIRTAH